VIPLPYSHFNSIFNDKIETLFAINDSKIEYEDEK
jgi:hypothetical protein